MYKIPLSKFSTILLIFVFNSLKNKGVDKSGKEQKGNATGKSNSQFYSFEDSRDEGSLVFLLICEVVLRAMFDIQTPICCATINMRLDLKCTNFSLFAKSDANYGRSMVAYVYSNF